jgi:hypothetical protein
MELFSSPVAIAIWDQDYLGIRDGLLAGDHSFREFDESLMDLIGGIIVDDPYISLILTAAGADLRASWSPMHWAVGRTFSVTNKILLASYAGVNNEFDRRAAGRSIQYGRWSTSMGDRYPPPYGYGVSQLQLLIAAGVDVVAIDDPTILSWVKDYGRPIMLSHLLAFTGLDVSFIPPRWYGSELESDEGEA